jgi:hypothetical protein
LPPRALAGQSPAVDDDMLVVGLDRRDVCNHDFLAVAHRRSFARE